MLRTRDLAEYLHVKPQTIRKWRMDNRGPSFFRYAGKGPAFYRKDDVDKWVNGRIEEMRGSEVVTSRAVRSDDFVPWAVDEFDARVTARPK